jgi:hypothetical protein
MTLNQVIKRIETLALAHKQVRSFKKGFVTDFFTDKTTQYPAVCLQDSDAGINLSGHTASLKYRMFIADLVHVSEDTKSNEQDVQSDMFSIAMDLFTQLNNPNYDDWKISDDNPVVLFAENENDLQAGCIIDFTISFIFPQNVCQVPTNIDEYTKVNG